MILALDQMIEPTLRTAALTRTDFDMLLDLYLAEQDGRCICMWDVCHAASAPFSTAHRRLTAMIVRGLVIRMAPRGDWRRVIIGLSADARALIEEVISATGIRSERGSEAEHAHADKPGSEPMISTGL
jgi:DNA-binding MarR family transcriptional regulator